MGDGWSVAWRLHDAQFWGVPQRRKRIALVADFRGDTAPEILFECEGVSGDFEESGEQGEGTPRNATEGAGETISFQERAGCEGGGRNTHTTGTDRSHSDTGKTGSLAVGTGHRLHKRSPQIMRGDDNECRTSKTLMP